MSENEREEPRGAEGRRTPTRIAQDILLPHAETYEFPEDPPLELISAAAAVGAVAPLVEAMQRIREHAVEAGEATANPRWQVIVGAVDGALAAQEVSRG
ncbi:MAG: hypothetical protein CMH55_07745 [Myxococcales bacterium]|nr:hypothetical protein [Myxococcales bacterium]|tara:strand:- start:522 stop:818 length:297 start_codon:yes stop_codon:yes gene_type:complete